MDQLTRLSNSHRARTCSACYPRHTPTATSSPSSPSSRKSPFAETGWHPFASRIAHADLYGYAAHTRPRTCRPTCASTRTRCRTSSQADACARTTTRAREAGPACAGGGAARWTPRAVTCICRGCLWLGGKGGGRTSLGMRGETGARPWLALWGLWGPRLLGAR